MTRPASSSTLRTRILTLVKIAVAAGAIFFLIHTGKLDYRDFNVPSEHWGVMALGFVFMCIAILIAYIRYHLLLRAVRIDIAFPDTLRIASIGLFFNAFMPGGLGGDVIKIAYVMRESGKRAEAVASAMVDRILGLLGLLSLGGIALFCSWEDVLANHQLHSLCLAILCILSTAALCSLLSMVALIKGRKAALLCWSVLVAGLVAFCIAALRDNQLALLSPGMPEWVLQPWTACLGTETGISESPQALLRGRALLVLAFAIAAALLSIGIVPSCQPGHRLESFVSTRLPMGRHFMSLMQSFLIYRNSFVSLLIAFGLSLLLQGLILVTLYCFSLSQPEISRPALSHIFFAAPPAFIVNTLPVSFGGLGVGEAAFDRLLALCRSGTGGEAAKGAALFLMYRLSGLLVGLSTGLPLYLRGKKEIQQLQEEAMEGDV